MKRLIVGAALLCIAYLAVLKAMILVYTGPLVNESGLAYNNTYDLNVANHAIDQLSAQAVYKVPSISAVTFTDGQVSTMSITVNSNASLSFAKATNKITIVTNSALTGAYITFNGVSLVEGTDWSKYSLSSTTALSLTNAINRSFSTMIIATVPTAGTVIYTTATASGAFANGYTLTSSTQSQLSVNSATFTGGLDNALIGINGVTLINGRDWTAATTSSGTAKAISDAIMANTSLNTIIASTWSMVAVSSIGVVTATSTAQGTSANYALFSSTPAALTFKPTSAMAGGSGNNVDTTTSKINKANTFTTALALLYTKTAGTSPANLVAGTTYYAIAVDLNNFKLATSSVNAIAGTNISISTTAAGGGSFTLTPLNYAGTASFRWQTSNDGTNFSDMSVSSVTYTSTSSVASSTLWDFGQFNYTYIRLKVIAPTAGGLFLNVTMTGKNSDNR